MIILYFVLPLWFHLWRAIQTIDCWLQIRNGSLLIWPFTWNAPCANDKFNEELCWLNIRLITIHCERFSSSSHMISLNIDLSHMFSVAVITVLRNYSDSVTVRYLWIVLRFLLDCIFVNLRMSILSISTDLNGSFNVKCARNLNFQLISMYYNQQKCQPIQLNIEKCYPTFENVFPFDCLTVKFERHLERK